MLWKARLLTVVQSLTLRIYLVDNSHRCWVRDTDSDAGTRKHPKICGKKRMFIYERIIREERKRGCKNRACGSRGLSKWRGLCLAQTWLDKCSLGERNGGDLLPEFSLKATPSSRSSRTRDSKNTSHTVEKIHSPRRKRNSSSINGGWEKWGAGS